MRLHLIRESQQRDELLQVVSHELRTPLTVIDGFNKLLLSERPGPLNEVQRHSLEQSRLSCQRLDLFVANLLAKDRLQSGVQPISRELHSIPELLDGLAAFLAPLVDESGQRLELRVADGAERGVFDPGAIEQVLVNLVGNALKYGPSGGVLCVSAQRLPGSPPFVELAVLDEGPGIPHDDRERIFEPYVRRAEHAGSGGLGLGLAICRRIVEAHGGSIGVGEGPEGGSRFAFTVPASQRAAEAST